VVVLCRDGAALGFHIVLRQRQAQARLPTRVVMNGSKSVARIFSGILDLVGDDDAAGFRLTGQPIRTTSPGKTLGLRCGEGG